MTKSLTEYVNLAQVGKSHGKHGEVVVHQYTDLPLSFFEGQRVCLTPPDLRHDRFHVIERIRSIHKGLLLKLSEISSINDANRIRNKLVLVRKADIRPANIDAVEQYQEEEFQGLSDMIGMPVIDKNHGNIGTLFSIISSPAQNLLQVDGNHGEVLIPVVPEIILKITEDAIYTKVVDGLIDLNEKTSSFLDVDKE